MNILHFFLYHDLSIFSLRSIVRERADQYSYLKKGISVGQMALSVVIRRTVGLPIRLLFILFCFLSERVYADVVNSHAGFLDFNLYPYLSDVDTDTSGTINIAAALKHRLSYFSLTNFGNQDGADELEDIDGFYTEQNIRWQIADQSPLDLTIQMNFRSGEDNDRHRLGFRWRLNNTPLLEDFFHTVHLAYSINFHVLQFDNEDANVWQMEHVYRMTFPQLSDRLYLAGFIDHTFNQDLPVNFPDNPIVGETQLGFRLEENFYAIVEYRINQYRRSDVNNTAIGIEYKIKW